MGRKWTDEQKQAQREVQLERVRRERLRPRVVTPPQINYVRFGFSIKADIHDFISWPPENVAAFMLGVGKVLAVTNEAN